MTSTSDSRVITVWPPGRMLRASAAMSRSERVWAAYLRRWTTWNHVRTVMSVLATTLLVLGIS